MFPMLSLTHQLHAFVAQERRQHTIYPPAHEVFTWTQQCKIRDVSMDIEKYFSLTKLNHRDDITKFYIMFLKSQFPS